MDHITVRHIVEAVSGTLLCGDADTELKHISIDSRSMRGADLFVPLIGEKQTRIVFWFRRWTMGRQPH